MAQKKKKEKCRRAYTKKKKKKPILRRENEVKELYQNWSQELKDVLGWIWKKRQFQRLYQKIGETISLVLEKTRLKEEAKNSATSNTWPISNFLGSAETRDNSKHNGTPFRAGDVKGREGEVGEHSTYGQVDHSKTGPRRWWPPSKRPNTATVSVEHTVLSQFQYTVTIFIILIFFSNKKKNKGIQISYLLTRVQLVPNLGTIRTRTSKLITIMGKEWRMFCLRGQFDLSSVNPALRFEKLRADIYVVWPRCTDKGLKLRNESRLELKTQGFLL